MARRLRTTAGCAPPPGLHATLQSDEHGHSPTGKVIDFLDNSTTRWSVWVCTSSQQCIAQCVITELFSPAAVDPHNQDVNSARAASLHDVEIFLRRSPVGHRQDRRDSPRIRRPSRVSPYGRRRVPPDRRFPGDEGRHGRLSSGIYQLYQPLPSSSSRQTQSQSAGGGAATWRRG